jgi:hypothetical protein
METEVMDTTDVTDETVGGTTTMNVTDGVGERLTRWNGNNSMDEVMETGAMDATVGPVGLGRAWDFGDREVNGTFSG